MKLFFCVVQDEMKVRRFRKIETRSREYQESKRNQQNKNNSLTVKLFKKMCTSIAPPCWKRQPISIHILAPVTLSRTVTNSEQRSSTARPDDDWMLVQDARCGRVRSALKGEQRSVLRCCSER